MDYGGKMSGFMNEIWVEWHNNSRIGDITHARDRIVCAYTF